MRKSITQEFQGQKPRAIVLDDNRHSRVMTGRRLRKRGFDVTEHDSVASFLSAWHPGTSDVIIADWDLSGKPAESGDHVLEHIRRHDWDVPFVLVSGKLDEDNDRAKVLARLLESGGARFVRRGNEGIARACEEAEDLVERRDLALLKVILSLRPAALAGQSVPTTTGEKPVLELLAEAVARPSDSHNFGRPIAKALPRHRIPPGKTS
jgi:CheY-like chemotaxis protein